MRCCNALMATCRLIACSSLKIFVIISREARSLIITSQVSILASIIDKWGFLIIVVQVIRLNLLSYLQFYQVVLPLILLTSKRCVAICTHCHDMTYKDYVVTPWIFRYNTAINKCERIVENRRACGGNVVTCMAKMHVALR